MEKRKVGRTGLEVPREVTIFWISIVMMINILVIMLLAFKAISLEVDSSKKTTITFTEAAYLGAQWSALTFNATLLAAFNLLTFGAAIINRLQVQHETR